VNKKATVYYCLKMEHLSTVEMTAELLYVLTSVLSSFYLGTMSGITMDSILLLNNFSIHSSVLMSRNMCGSALGQSPLKVIHRTDMSLQSFGAALTTALLTVTVETNKKFEQEDFCERYIL